MYICLIFVFNKLYTMPYQNEHSARVRQPEEFQADSFRRKNVDDGVDIIIGKLKGEDNMTTQAYRFQVGKFTEEQAKKWLSDNNIEYIDFEPAINDRIVEGHIYVYGEIIGDQTKDIGNYGFVNLKDIVDQLKDNKEANRIVVHIHSPGGDVYEGFAIHDALINSGKEIITIIEGLCASIATVIALSGQRRYITTHSEFMIHTPWSFAVGDSEDFKDVSEQLAKTENKIAEFYAKHTNLNIDDILNYMHNETFFTADEAVDYGFCTGVINTIRQAAKLKTNYNMEKTVEKLNAIERMLLGIKNLIAPPKNLVLQDVNGVEIDFGEDVKTVDEIQVGMTATIDGDPASGEHIMPFNKTYVFENGKLTEIKDNESQQEEVDVLKEENQNLLNKIQELTDLLNAEKAKNEENQKMLNKVISDFQAFKNEYSNGGQYGINTPDDPPIKVRKAFKNN